MEVIEPRSDPCLPALARLLGAGELVAYRPTRRAVVRLPDDGAGHGRFAKVLRPGRAARIVARHHAMEAAASAAGPGFPSFPRVLEWSDGEGLVVLSGAPGRSLYALVRQDPGATGPATAVGRALACLHVAPLPSGLRAAPRARPLDRWMPRIAPFVDAATLARYESVLVGLPPAREAGRPGLVHGDLHDGNVFVRDDEVALIDLDAAGAGDPAADVGTLAAHLVLRGLQAGGDPGPGRRMALSLVRAYVEAGGPAEEPAIGGACARGLFRLACVYVVRPRWRGACPALLEEAARSDP